MANTLTGLLPTIYEALDIVSREQVGFIPAVTRNVSAERAALNQTIDVPITQEDFLIDVTPAVTAPNNGDTTVGTVPIMITKSKAYPVRWNGEETKGLQTSGMYHPILLGRFQQGFRALSNAIDLDLFNEAYQSASRATGIAGTAPFGTPGDLSGTSNLRQILDDNGAPPSDLQFVMGSSAVANLRGKQTILLKSNEEGNSEFRRTGNISLEKLSGFNLHNSAQVRPVVKGTGTGYVSSGATALGVDAVALITGTGTVLAGDVVTFAGDANNYVVNTGIAAPGTIDLGNPGLRAALASGSAMTIGNGYTPNVGFARSAMQLVARTPAMPVGPDGVAMDMADDMIDVTDPFTGMVYTITMYKQYKQIVYFIEQAWGVSCIKSEHVGILMG